MATIYTDNPHNFSDIEPYIITQAQEIAQEIIMAEKCYFYDTCSFRKHVQIIHQEYQFEFIKRTGGVVVITRTILMELASHSGTMNQEYVEYIKKMHTEGLKVLVMYEEDLFYVLEQCFSTNATINGCLSIAVCIHLLANIPDIISYKYVVLTEDKGAIGIINKASKNVFEHNGKYSFSALTTTRLTQRLYEKGIITNKSQVEEILSGGASDDMIKVLASEEYDLEPKEKTMTYQELAEKIVTPNAIHINYQYTLYGIKKIV